jgi:hypothetical protein
MTEMIAMRIYLIKSHAKAHRKLQSSPKPKRMIKELLLLEIYAYMTCPAIR